MNSYSFSQHCYYFKTFILLIVFLEAMPNLHKDLSIALILVINVDQITFK